MNIIERTCEQIVSPPKFRYSLLDMGNQILIGGRRYDFSVTNKFQLNLKCSLYVPRIANSHNICVVYLHSMNGSRLECLLYVQRILELGLYLCSFDFSGCGNSDGNSISFGANQKYDIDSVVEYMAKQYNLTKIILWGRSMGAVATLKYYQLLSSKYSQIQIHGLILDSPFQSLYQLILELGIKRTQMPKIVIQLAYHFIKNTLQKKGNFQIEQLQMLETIKTMNETPIMFLVSQNDTTIDPQHSQSLFQSYPFPNKRLIYFKGLHNESRDQIYLKNILAFLRERVNGFDEKKKASVKYKRIILEEEVVRRMKRENENLQNSCQCQIFSFKDYY